MQIEVPELVMHVREIDRSAEGLEYYRKNPNARRDILLCNFLHLANVFFEPDGTASVEYSYGLLGDRDLTDHLEDVAVEEYEKRKEFVKKQVEFFKQL